MRDITFNKESEDKTNMDDLNINISTDTAEQPSKADLIKLSWREQVLTIPAGGYIPVYFNDTEPNNFRLLNYGDSVLYFGINNIPDNGKFEQVINPNSTTKYARANGTKVCYIYNSGLADAECMITTWEKEFEVDGLADAKREKKYVTKTYYNQTFIIQSEILNSEKPIKIIGISLSPSSVLQLFINDVVDGLMLCGTPETTSSYTYIPLNIWVNRLVIDPWSASDFSMVYEVEE